MVKRAGKVMWLCLLAGCSLRSEPTSASGSQRASIDAGEWRPEQRPTSKRDAGMETPADASAPITSSKDSAPVANGGRPSPSQPAKAGASSSAPQGGTAATPAADGGKSASAGAGAEDKPAQPSGGAGAVAVMPTTPPPASPAGAGAPAAMQPSAAAGMPAPAGTSGSTAPTSPTAPRNPREALVNAVIAVLMRNGGTDQGDWSDWQRAAGGTGELSPEFVTPMLNSLLLSRTCFERIEACVSVCVIVSQNCAPCAADMDCRAALSRLCGERAAMCPASMPTTPPNMPKP